MIPDNATETPSLGHAVALPQQLRKELEQQHYKIVGSHSAVKTCHWTRKALEGRGVCYKQLWYGVQSHRCLQMTPWISCDQRCEFCWRSIEKAVLTGLKSIDEPSDIIDGCIREHRRNISGFLGTEMTDRKLWKEAQNPTNAAISLLGEPLMYPKISGLIDEFVKRKITTFLVTNGQHPKAMNGMSEPTQLYISLDAPDKKTYLKTDRPRFKDYWERLNKSLELMDSFKCRKVIRLTLVKGLNMTDPEGYAKLIKLANPDFVEAKAFMHVGEAQKRLPRSAMPSHEEVKEFGAEVAKHLGYNLAGEQLASRVVLLKAS
jgi:tRNA wybutosine-synthesizing protein 1